MKKHSHKQLAMSIKAMSLGCLALGFFSAVATADEIQLLMVQDEQLLIHMPLQQLIIYGDGYSAGDYSYYLLNAWGTSPLNGATAGHSGLVPPGSEASTGTGHPSPMPPRPQQADGSDPISTNEAAQGSGIVISQSDWGYAEVLFHCENADVVLYQNIDGELLEVLSTNVSTERC